VARLLWTARDVLGRWCGLGRISVDAEPAEPAEPLPIPGTGETSLASRLPMTCAVRRPGWIFSPSPFVPLYRTDDEFAAELSNRTIHAVIHLAWAEQASGDYQGQMAVYVKPRGWLGSAYMAFIKPFRYLVVYPALMRYIERAWNRRVPTAVGAAA
jgi:Protein of unknown function (DUF2867)